MKKDVLIGCFATKEEAIKARQAANNSHIEKVIAKPSLPKLDQKQNKR